MVATNEKVQFDFDADFGDSNYKSCFARSVVVNAQVNSRQQSKTIEFEPDKQKTKETEVFQIKKEPPVLVESSAAPRRLSCPTELPVEQLALQSQLDTLHWQLRQAEASRQMYRAVMQQVVAFLERAHRSLSLLAQQQRADGGSVPVQRSRSEYHVGLASPRRQQPSPDQVPPEKLSQEAFRLWRTVQSLLGTREPDLAHVSDDQDFLTQLAREFPSRPHRAASFCVATQPQLLSRKLSLQRAPPLLPNRKKLEDGAESKRSSIAAEKPASPKTGSVSSAEDESGFSSMNSFQEVGVPLVPADAETPTNEDGETSDGLHSAQLLWTRSEQGLPNMHRRWSSTPVEAAPPDPLKVLWV